MQLIVDNDRSNLPNNNKRGYVKRLLLLCAVLLSGCVTSSPVALPNGTQGISISCNGAMRSYSDCMNKAGEICGATGYQILDKDGLTSATLVANQYSATMMPVVRREMIVKCNGAQ